MYVVSETEPLAPEEGKAWYKPSLAAVYKFLSGAWIPWAGGSKSITFDVGLNIYIRGVKRNSNIDNESFVKKDNLTYRVDTCKFILWDDTSGQTIRPSQGDNVEVFWWKDGDITATKIFGGEIINMPQTERAPGSNKYNYNISCRDHGGRLKKDLVVEVYEDKTCKEIIDDLVLRYATEFSTGGVETGVKIKYISWNYKTVDRCIGELAKLTGYDWYVDENKVIHFFISGSKSAPYTITDDITTSGKYKNLKINVDKSQYRNRVFLQGGFYMSNDFTDVQTIGSDPEEKSWTVRYKPYKADSEAIEIYINGAPKTLGIDGIDETGKDFLINQSEKNVKALDYVPVAGNILKLIYKYKVPILVKTDSDKYQSEVQTIEGGDGIYEYRFADKNIETIEAAVDRAEAELKQFAPPVIKGSFRTSDSGYRSGQLLNVNCPTRGYTDRQFLIQSVTTKVLGKSTLEYSIVFATRLKSFEEYLIELHQGSAQQEIIIREGEILQKLKDFVTEQIIMTDDVFRKDTGLPYEWGPGGDRQAKWNAPGTNLDTTTFVWA